jgi:hypothetical protein
MPDVARGDSVLIDNYAGENPTALCNFGIGLAFLIGTNKGHVYFWGTTAPLIAIDGEIVTALTATDLAVYIGTNKGMIYEYTFGEWDDDAEEYGPGTLTVLANMGREILSLFIWGYDDSFAPFLLAGIEGGSVFLVAIEAF